MTLEYLLKTIKLHSFNLKCHLFLVRSFKDDIEKFVTIFEVGILLCFRVAD